MIKVAIVEDHTEYGLVLRDIINHHPNFVITEIYPNAEMGLVGLGTSPVEIVIIDIRLPGMSGIELIGRLKAIFPDINYLVCSTHQDNDSIFQSLKAGASGYMLKDSTAEQIINALEELSNGGAPMSPYIAKKIVMTFHEPAKNENPLSKREQEITELLAQGMPYSEIANKIFLSVETVKTHIKNIYAKLHVKNKIEAINKIKSSFF